MVGLGVDELDVDVTSAADELRVQLRVPDHLALMAVQASRGGDDRREEDCRRQAQEAATSDMRA